MNGFEILPSSSGGSDPLKLDLAGGTMTGQLVLQLASATGALNLAPTWNNAGTDFSLIYARVTNTASGANSKLIDLGTVAGGSLFSVSKSGGVSCVGVRSNDAYLGVYGPGVLNLINEHASITLGLYNDCTFMRDYAAGTGIVTFCAPYGGTSSFRVSGDNGAGAKYLNMHHDGTNAVIAAVGGGSLHLSSLPTSNPGPGILWNNAGTPAIGT